MLISVSRVLPAIILTLLLTQSASAWIDCNWHFQSKVVITEQSGSNLNSYQVLLTLNASSMHANYNWSSAGDDLRVLDSNDSTHLDYYVQSWNAATKQAEVWVIIPSLPANSNKTIYLYYGNPTVATTGNAGVTLTQPGIKFHTRYSTANPNNKAAAFNFFNAGNDNTAGYGCKFISNFTGISNKNQFTPSTHNNFIAYSETFFKVNPSEVGTWSVRYGADFGRGGALYVDGTPLEEDWNGDLWWSGNWGHVDVLQGSINLNAGYHRLEVIGAEGCCDGGITVQYKKPGGTFTTYSTGSIDIVSSKCPAIEPTSTFPTKAYHPPAIKISKKSQVISDPVNLTNLPKRIPGARVRYTITVTNTGAPVDIDSINIKDPIPANTLIQLANPDFTFQDGSPPSGLNFVYSGSNNGSDDVSFSNNNGTNFLFQPTMDAENSNTAITHFQLSPKGRLGCSNTGQAISFSLKYDVKVD
ncbi:MAG: CCXG family PEP-CTERM protein [Cocleimonas sp.]